MDDLPLILVINLTRDIERWKRISAALKELDLRFIRVRAIDARSKFGLIRARIQRQYFSAAIRRALTPGECGCALSHIAALKRVVRANVRSAIILEDDAIFANGFRHFLENDFQKFLNECDVVKLEGIEYNYTSKTGRVLAKGSYSKLIVPLRPTLGSAAYGVTQVGARRLIRTFAALSDPLDHMLAYYERHRIAYGEVRPFLVRQSDVVSNLDLERNLTKSLDFAATERYFIVFSRLISKVTRGAVRLALVARTLAASRLRALFNAVHAAANSATKA